MVSNGKNITDDQKKLKLKKIQPRITIFKF